MSRDAIIKILALIAALLCGIQISSWIDVRTPAIADLRARTLLLAPIPAPDYSTFDAAKLKQDQEPFGRLGRVLVARLTFEHDGANEPRALFIRRARDNYAVYLNGQLLSPVEGVLGEKSTLHGFRPKLIVLLPALTKLGTNHLDILVARNATNAALREVYFGPEARLRPQYEHTRFMTHDMALYAAIMGGLVFMFAMAVSSIVQKPALMLTIALTLAFFVARQLHSLWLDVPWPQMYRDIFLIMVATFLWVSAAAFVNEWTSGPRYFRRVALGVAGVAALTIITFYSIWICHTAYHASTWVEIAVGLLALPYMIYRMVLYYAGQPWTSAGEIFVGGIGLMMALLLMSSVINWNWAAGSISAVHDEAFGQLASTTLLVIIAIGLARHGVSVYRLAQLNNETLLARVSAKEEELRANHELLRVQEGQQAAMAERARIMRDVHDGIGSHLLGLLVQARAGKLEGNQLNHSLQAALDDLHLVVDSLDQVEGSLETVLGTFRARIEPKIEAAGVAMSWNVEPLAANNALSPASVLQIYRILQEAVSNAIKHAKARHLDLSVKPSASQNGWIEVEIRDDGAGFDPALVRSGKGLANMKKRATTIGATLDIKSSISGSLVRILLPG